MLINKLILEIFNPGYSEALKRVFESERELLKNSTSTQKSKLNSILNHCIQNVPFYKKIESTEQVSIHHFPVIDKEIIKTNFESFVAQNVTQKRRKKNSTSGSTGTNFFFYSDYKTDVYRDAFVNLGENWAGANISERKLIIWGAERDMINNSLKKKLINSKFLFNTKMISSYHMTNEDIEKNIIPTIKSFKPKVIVGYPSSLGYIAEYILKNNIKLNIDLKGVITSGESLSIFNREIIESAFATKVFNRYGCRDVGPIAHECKEHKGLHVFSDHVYIEILNEKGEECMPGEIGEIVVTDLDNFVFPFIRYKIGDIGKWATYECTCGRKLPLLESVEGRTFDLIIGTNNNRVPGNYFTLLRNKLKGIDQFQIIQERVGLLEVRLKVNEEYHESSDTKLIALMKEKLGDDMNIKVKHVPNLDTTISGKFRWVVSNINLYEKY
jgi:phenylacetate-CoA ligase